MVILHQSKGKYGQKTTKNRLNWSLFSRPIFKELPIAQKAAGFLQFSENLVQIIQYAPKFFKCENPGTKNNLSTFFSIDSIIAIFFSLEMEKIGISQFMAFENKKFVFFCKYCRKHPSYCIANDMEIFALFLITILNTLTAKTVFYPINRGGTCLRKILIRIFVMS